VTILSVSQTVTGAIHHHFQQHEEQHDEATMRLRAMTGAGYLGRFSGFVPRGEASRTNPPTAATMRWRVAVLLALAGMALTACTSGGGGEGGGAGTVTAGGPATISVRSSAFQAGGAIPKKYTCSGDEVSPPLSWSGVPSGTRELALVVDDPDAGGFVHWVLAGIDPGVSAIAEGNVPRGAVEVSRYKGPCPPSGTHHYQFTVYALPSDLQFAQGGDPRDAITRMQRTASAHGQLVGTFSAG
jgi:Raf kinase inhibitor-like YbhB/YbcL family protein